MENKQTEVITAPSALATFKCIGPACSDNCCKGWDVDIDKATYQSYLAMADSPLKSRFEKEIQLNPDSTDGEFDYALMILTAKRNCPFLNDKDWCDIQATHGEAALSKVCHNFPRTFNRIDGAIEMSATLSCPEVARLILSEQKRLVFSPDPVKRQRYVLNQDVVQTSDGLIQHPAKFLLPLRNLTSEILSNEHFTFYQRLGLLGLFHEGMLPMHTPEGVDAIPAHIKRFEGYLKRGAGPKPLAKMKPSAQNQLTLMGYLNAEFPDFFKLESGEFGRVSLGVATEFGSGKKKDTAALARLQGLHQSHLMPFIQANPYFFENYCQHFVFKFLYPFSEEGDPYMAYTLLMMRIYLIQMHLCQLADMHNLKEITLEDGIWVVQKLTKLLEHNRLFFVSLGEDLMEIGYDHLSFLGTLVV